MSKTQHFTTGDYTVIKTAGSIYSFAGRGNYELLKHMERLDAEIRLKQRQFKALQAVLANESELTPEALAL